MATTKKPREFVPCVPVALPAGLEEHAAAQACAVNPANAVSRSLLWGLIEYAAPRVAQVIPPQRIAVLTSRYWGAGGVRLRVRFLEQTSADLAGKILSHMNAWGTRCNVTFTADSSSAAEVRITRAGQGYWSYLGTDVLQIPAGQPTMCLQGFTLSTPEAEYRRVVRHEAGHTLGCPHEHMRPDIIQLLDPEKTIAYFRQNVGWDRQTTIQQVLTPLREADLKASPSAEPDSIMCYQFAGACTRSGKPIPGGADITEGDFVQMAKLYPKPDAPPPPPPPAGDAVSVSRARLVALIESAVPKVSA